MSRAVVLLSGGLDSATALAIAVSEQHEAYTLTLDYGQRSRGELERAAALSEHYDVRDHRVISLDLAGIGGSALTDEGLEVPEEMQEGIPVTYVPARNSIMLSVALAWAEVLGADSIYIGVNSVDYSGYPDCRPEFVEAFQRVSELGTRKGVEGKAVEIRAPLLKMSKSEIIAKGLELGVPYELTWSCYRDGEAACGRCDSCRLRLKGFADAGFEDPISYEVSG